MTRPTSTPSARSTASNWASASRSLRTRHPRSSSAAPTSSSARRRSCSAFCGGSEPGALLGELENLRQRLDRRAPPFLAGRREALARRAELDGRHPRPLCARQLVVGAVADEQALRRLDGEPFAGDLVDPRVRL